MGSDNKPYYPPASKAWFFLPIFLGIIGGAIAWAAVRGRNPPQARKMLVVGTVISAAFVALIAVGASLDDAPTGPDPVEEAETLPKGAVLLHDAFATQVALFDAIDPEDETGLDARGAYLLVWYADRIALIDPETHALSDPTEENCGHLDDAWKEAYYTPEFDRYYVEGDDFTDVPDDEFYGIIAWRLLEYHDLDAGLHQLAYDNLEAWDDLQSYLGQAYHDSGCGQYD